MNFILTYIIKVTVLSNMQKILAVTRCLLKSYKQKKFWELHIIFDLHIIFGHVQ